jgi:tetratricopeptide (TPR) repeat protein
MENQLLNTDEAIIKEYGKIRSELGGTEKCYNDLENLINKISPEKKDLWKIIIEGLLYCLKGDGFGIRSYDNKEEYYKAYEILNNVIKKIEDKNSLLFLFTEKHKITSLALSFRKPIKDIIFLFDNIINSFIDNENHDIQGQIVSTMLDKSFVLGKYYDHDKSHTLFRDSLSLQKDIIKRYKSFEDPHIQENVAITLNNRAFDFGTLAEKYEKKQGKIWETVISNYKDNKESALQIQVSKAMFNKAMSLYIKHITEEAKQQKGVALESEKNYLEPALNACDDLINHFKQSEIVYIQQDVAMAMSQKSVILQQQDKIDEALKIYTELINLYKDSNDYLVKFSVADAMKSKAELLEGIGEDDEALKVYTAIIKAYKDPSNGDIFNLLTKIAKAKKQEIEQEKQETAHEKQEIDRRLKTNRHIKDLIEFYPNNKRNINELTSYIKNAKIVPFIGAGLSKFAGYPLWSEFLDNIFEEYKDRERIKSIISDPNFKKFTCTMKASLLKKNMGQALIVREIIDAFKDKEREREHFLNQPVWILPDLFNGLILTTNFDKLIERVYDLQWKTHIATCSVSDINRLDNIRNDIILYKLHGTIDEPGKIILTQEDYIEHYKEGSPHYSILNKHVSGKNILFIGCGLTGDEELIPFYKDSFNFAIYPCSSQKDTEENEFKLSAKNIIPILFPENDFSYIKYILEYIKDKIRPL